MTHYILENLNFNLLRTSPEFDIDQIDFNHDSSHIFFTIF